MYGQRTRSASLPTQGLQDRALVTKLLIIISEQPEGRLTLDHNQWHRIWEAVLPEDHGKTPRFVEKVKLQDLLDRNPLVFTYARTGTPSQNVTIIELNTSLGLCSEGKGPDGCADRNCPKLHYCWFFLEGKCKFGAKCTKGHRLETDRNRWVLVNHMMDRVPPENVLKLLKLCSRPRHGSASSGGAASGGFVAHCEPSRMTTVKPEACRCYNSGKNCQRGAMCAHLHVCQNYLSRACDEGSECQWSHNIFDTQPKAVLIKLGFNVNRSPKIVLGELRQAMEGDSNSRSDTACSPCGITYPQLCTFYNNQTMCRYADKCKHLHVCKHYVTGDCKFKAACKRSHNILDTQPAALLRGCGVNVRRSPKEILKELRWAMEGNGRRNDGDAELDDGSDRDDDDASESDPESVDSRTDDLEICVFHLRGKCHYGRSCKHHHPPGGAGGPLPYLWQRRTGTGHWVDFSQILQAAIECSYCDPANSQFVCKGAANEVYTIQFTGMKCDWVHLNTGEAMSDPVRRLTTKSNLSVTSDRRLYLTLWRWYWKNDEGVWHEYGLDAGGAKLGGSVTSRALEEEYESNPDGKFSFVRKFFTYSIDFKDMLQVNSMSRCTREVRRRPEVIDPVTKQPRRTSVASGATSSELSLQLGHLLSLSPRSASATASTLPPASSDIKYPDTWNFDQRSDNDYFQIVLIQSTGATAKEYAEIAQLFAVTMPSTPIKSIKRIQNSDLWDAFVRMQAKMEKKLRGPPVNQTTVVGGASAVGVSLNIRRLFHGTKKICIDAICQQGFDWRMNGSSAGTVYGKGSYFARDALYSRSYTDCSTMFVVKVLVGESAVGNSTMVRPPPKDPSNPLVNLHDSCVDKVVNPKIFVVFNQDQAYPEYLIEFKA